jgi:hypothetical protein
VQAPEQAVITSHEVPVGLQRWTVLPGPQRRALGVHGPRSGGTQVLPRQVRLAPHAAPSASPVHAVIDLDGWQISHVFVGLGAFGAVKAPAMKQPLWHAAALHTWPPPQLEPSASAVHDAVDVAGSQRSHAFAGSSALAAANVPPMKQPLRQAAALHTWPPPHAVPSAKGAHDAVDVAESQRSHAFTGSTVPLATNAPAMKQPLWHNAALHTLPVPHAVPFATAVHPLVDAAGSHA